jgi:50S ribosomal subunit-associated GTPase HflX
MEVVTDVLTGLEAHTNPTLTVYNKCDIQVPEGVGENAVKISAATGLGIENLKAAITQKLATLRTEITILLPLNAGAVVSGIYKTGEVHSCAYQEDGIQLNATVTPEDAARLRAIACKQK